MNILAQKRRNIKEKEKNLNLQAANLENIEEVLSHGYNRGIAKVFNYLLGISNNCTVIFPTQETIARAIDMSPAHVNVLCGRLKKLGFMHMIQRRKPENISKDNPVGQTSNIYILHPMFRDMHVRDRLKHILPMLVFFPLALLLFTNSQNMQATDNSSSAEFQHQNILNIYINKANTNANKLITNSVCADTREELARLAHNKKIILEKRKAVMSDKNLIYDNDIFTQEVRNAGKELHMTLGGMCSIAAFSDIVISVALKRFREYGKEIAKPYGFFVKICNDTARDMDVKPRHGRSYALAKELALELANEPSVFEEGLRPRKPNIPTNGRGKGSSSGGYQKSANHHASPSGDRYSAINSQSLKEFDTEEFGHVVQYAPGSKTYCATREDGSRYFVSRDKEGNFHSTFSGTKTVDSRRVHPSSTAKQMDLGPVMRELGKVFDAQTMVSKNEETDEERLARKREEYNEHNNFSLKKGPAMPTTDREFTAEEENLIQWFRDYYKHVRSVIGTVPSWYDGITKNIKERTPNLGKHLSLIKHTLEANGWRRQPNGSFAQTRMPDMERSDAS